MTGSATTVERLAIFLLTVLRVLEGVVVAAVVVEVTAAHVTTVESQAIFPGTVPVNRKDVEVAVAAAAVVPVMSVERKVIWHETALTSSNAEAEVVDVVGPAISVGKRVT